MTLSFAACGRTPAPKPKPEPAPTSVRPAALWDHREDGPRWTKAAMTALDAHGAVLVETVPADVEKYCPGYPEAGPETRKGFWVVFLSA
ncbi:MAG: ABC transporter permease, partial [Rhodobacteraceae bacterium]|nr:ABC transporter permease [Paracoccaceae bacterium]